uniref:protein BT_0846 n=1 Tax=Bacteroides thetaiotaomicron (strain ATCC 29148 / DSM 2079 / JCM 5827 / CCUG 10774 / NCTC 10582 / VPI-5482 / E50) TaxID=226186 RepID=UPI0002C3921B|nr:Chain A, protein BT_0846 [Bacteroides thetaiotaomicron VPI-5482]
GEDWTELNSNNIIGYWSTGIEGTHKLLSFDEDGTGSFGIYSNATPISFQMFDYKIEEGRIYIYDVYPDEKTPYYLDCKISGTTLKVETGSEAGTYKKQK